MPIISIFVKICPNVPSLTRPLWLVQVRAELPDGSPAGGVPVEVCAAGACKNITTKDDGRLTALVNTQDTNRIFVRTQSFENASRQIGNIKLEKNIQCRTNDGFELTYLLPSPPDVYAELPRRAAVVLLRRDAEPLLLALQLIRPGEWRGLVWEMRSLDTSH